MAVESIPGASHVKGRNDPVHKILLTDQNGAPYLTMHVDEASSDLTYVGYAQPGSLTSDSVWRIKKIEVSGTVTSIEWADANGSYDNEWDERAALSYS